MTVNLVGSNKTGVTLHYHFKGIFLGPSSELRTSMAQSWNRQVQFCCCRLQRIKRPIRFYRCSKFSSETEICFVQIFSDAAENLLRLIRL